jgi:hypothetical protein
MLGSSLSYPIGKTKIWAQVNIRNLVESNAENIIGETLQEISL